MDLQILEKRINEAIDIRENGDLVKSRSLFEKILEDIQKLLLQDSSKKLKNIYVTAMGEYVIQYRLEAAESYKEALKLGKQLLKYDRKYKVGNPLSIRSVSNTLIDLGAYEQAEKFLKDLIPLYEADSAKLGDTKAHLAYCLFRTARIEKSYKLVNEAIKDIKLNTAKDKYVSNRLSRSLNFKALVLNAKGEVNEALKIAQEAFSIAKENNNVFRINQTREIIDYLVSKSKTS